MDKSIPWRIVPCRDPSCLWCREDIDTCIDPVETDKCRTVNCSLCIKIYGYLEICKAFTTRNENGYIDYETGRVLIIEKRGVELGTAGGQYYGLVSESLPYLVHRCLDPNCYNCWPSFRVCTQCQRGNHEFNGTCHRAPLGYGFVKNSSELRPCKVEGCRECIDNYLTCHTPCLQDGCSLCTKSLWTCDNCDYISDLFTKELVYLLNNTCYTLDKFPLGFGIVLSRWEHLLAPCLDRNCLNCSLDHTSCIECKLPSDPDPRIRVIIFRDRCIYYIPKMGYNASLLAHRDSNSSLALLPCVDPLCLVCTNNISSCKVCDYIEDTLSWITSSIPNTSA
jgi:hypothetical protein